MIGVEEESDEDDDDDWDDDVKHLHVILFL